LLKDLQVSAANVLRRAGLPDDLLARPSVRLDAANFHRFWDSVEAEVGDPLLPLRLCRTISSEAFSPPLFAALCSPNFLVAIQRIAHYKTLVAPMRLDVTEGEHRITVDLRWPDDANQPPVSLVLSELLFFVTLCRLATREHVCPLRVTTRLLPQDARAYADYLGVPIQQGESHRLELSQTDALRPFLTSNAGLWRAFEPELRTRLAELDASVQLAERVRAALLEALPSGLVDISSIAQKLAVSKRSLQRQLEAEGVSFKVVLQETRRALATHYLKKTSLPSAEISFLLGFEEPNSFYRAFRLWSGQTPDEVRQERVS